MIHIEDLSVCYQGKDGPITAIENINLHISQGEICAVIGPSGGGKSTLLKVLAGIIKGYRGRVLIDGRKVDPKTHRIGFIPQNDGLIKWRTVEQNIGLSAKIKDGRKHIDRNYYRELIKRLNIQGMKERYPNQLSGGEKQRVSLARVFLLKPHLLLMDESFSALDAITREEVRRVFLDVWKAHRVTTIFVTHDINEAIFLGEKVVVLSAAPGKVVNMMHNPLFGKSCSFTTGDCAELNRKLRKMLRGDQNHAVSCL